MRAERDRQHGKQQVHVDCRLAGPESARQKAHSPPMLCLRVYACVCLRVLLVQAPDPGAPQWRAGAPAAAAGAAPLPPAVLEPQPQAVRDPQGPGTGTAAR